MGTNMTGNNMLGNNMMEPDSESEEDQQDMQPQGSNVVVPVSASLTASGSDGAAPAAVPAPAQPIAGPQLTFTPHGNGIYNKDDTAAVTRSSSVLRGLPRSRLSAALEKLDSEIDAGFVASLSMKGLLILLWMFTRIRPATKVTHLRCLA